MYLYVPISYNVVLRSNAFNACYGIIIVLELAGCFILSCLYIEIVSAVNKSLVMYPFFLHCLHMKHSSWPVISGLARAF